MHVYIAAPLEAARAAAVSAASATGITCVHPERLRSGRFGAADECYFELTMGPGNSLLPVEVWIAGWRALLENIGAAKGAA